jgi:hypothetical protein
MIKIYFDDTIPDYILYLVKNFKFELSSLNDCDYVISCRFKSNTNYTLKQIQDNINHYIKYQKKVIIFLISTKDEELTIPYNVMLIRTSLYKSNRKINEFVLPILWNNYNEYIFKPIKITNFPIIGYMGKLNKYNENFIMKLQKTENLITNIIKTDVVFNCDINNNIEEKDEIMFIKNIEESHFYLCLRENNNCPSYLYKVLSLGRIPIILDSNFYLPFEQEIDWNEIAIIGKNDGEITNKIRKWWIEKDITEIQLKCKKVSSTYFNINNYVENIFLNLYDPYNNYNKFPIPFDFDINIYSKYNDLEKLTFSDMIKHYIENGEKEGRIYKLPINFNINNYRTKNLDLINLNYDQLIKHYIYNGYKEKRIF